MSRRFRVMIAQSADGLIADAAGGVEWLDRYQEANDHGYGAFIREIDTIVMGRATYEVARHFGAWPYPDQQCLVLSARPLDDPPPRVARTALDVPALGAALREGEGDVWVLGGGRTIRGFLDAGLIDLLELFVVPEILGAGVPLFPPGHAAFSLSFKGALAFPTGIVRLTYQRN
ncbi:MAG: dihydrofolate reductase [Alphaproteobacteria bacterium]|nr:dihydrofolate reductase [Alphaproteobacteria bacterium]